MHCLLPTAYCDVCEMLGPYVEKGLEQSDLSSFPLVLRDIQLNAKYLKNQFDTGGLHILIYIYIHIHIYIYIRMHVRVYIYI